MQLNNWNALLTCDMLQWLVFPLQFLRDTFDANIFSEVAEACAATCDFLHVGFGEPAPFPVRQPDAFHPAWWKTTSLRHETNHCTLSFAACLAASDRHKPNFLSYIPLGTDWRWIAVYVKEDFLPSLVMVLAWRMSAFSSVNSSCSWAW